MPHDLPGDAPADEPVGPCRACSAPTVAGQRYCLACGALVGERRMEPLQVLAARAPRADPAPAAGRPRAVPLVAAASAVLLAGVSGALVTAGGDPHASASLRAAAVAPAAATAPVVPAAPRAPDAPADDDPVPAAAAAAGTEPAAAEDAPADDGSAAAEPAADAAADDAGPDADDAAAGDDGASGEDGATGEDEPIAPHVWVLALDGPRAAEAIDRVADRGVRLTGLAGLSFATLPNASALVTGLRPTTPPLDPAPASLPEELQASGGDWRSYVDAQPGAGAGPLAGACAAPPAGDAAAAVLAGRLPFGRIAALQPGCAGATKALEEMGNDLSAGTIPALSVATLGGCAPPERPVVALPDQVDDAVAQITESTEFQASGLLVVTTVGAADPCPAPGAPPAPPLDPATPPPAAPTVVLAPGAEAGATLDTAGDLLALTRLTAATLGVAPPGVAGAEDVPALRVPGVPAPATPAGD
ncbi:hypothetical protein [Patulibacter sp. SYSU D01012]|uniref:hypothetical protein n=1 Tax=Patulibacter sp. SYSU D01012 TaxID=2817381 RepID=UPI001B3053D8|nr:hypothetical protein [Patulibacter sp. SYSU D01012]